MLDKEKKKAIRVRPTGEYPADWDDLIASNKKVIATIYTAKEGEKDNRKGIKRGKDGIYDIVVPAREINNEVVRNALKDLEKRMGKRYLFVGSPSPEDKIIDYAQKMMRPIKKYGTPSKGYDFSQARTAKQKSEVIGIWIGEILYEALTYKDAEVVKSLAETIKIEIVNLIKP